MKITEIITGLEEYKQIVQDAIESLGTLVSVNTQLGLTQVPTIALPPPAVAAPAAAQLPENTERPKLGPKKEGTDKPKAMRGGAKRRGGHGCEKHPDSEAGTRGRCMQCARDYAREWARKKKAGKTSVRSQGAAEMRSPSPKAVDDKLSRLADRNRPPAPTVPVPRRRPADFDGDELEYSKVITCSKCHATTRYSRPEEFDPLKDSWTCVANGCQVRINLINLAVDRGYEPDAA